MDKKAALEVFFVFEGRGIQPGGFTESLIHTIARADSFNRDKLFIAFPEYVDAVNAYGKGSQESYEALEKLAFGV